VKKKRNLSPKRSKKKERRDRKKEMMRGNKARAQGVFAKETKEEELEKRGRLAERKVGCLRGGKVTVGEHFPRKGKRLGGRG